MFAKSGMVVGKLLTVAVLTVGSTAHAQIRMSESMYKLYNAIVKMTDGLTTDDRRKYEQAVYTALANLDNGEFVRWYSDDSYNHGIVEVVATAKLSGQTCRRIYTTVITEKSKTAEERWACYNESTKLWEFFK
jgi:surface antigen